jgi:hypothetical protein
VSTLSKNCYGLDVWCVYFSNRVSTNIFSTCMYFWTYQRKRNSGVEFLGILFK